MVPGLQEPLEKVDLWRRPDANKGNRYHPSAFGGQASQIPVVPRVDAVSLVANNQTGDNAIPAADTFVSLEIAVGVIDELAMVSAAEQVKMRIREMFHDASGLRHDPAPRSSAGPT